MIRYFFISYSCGAGFGNIYFETLSSIHPSHKEIRQTISDRQSIDIERVIILFIHEFNNESDFMTFKSKE